MSVIHYERHIEAILLMPDNSNRAIGAGHGLAVHFEYFLALVSASVEKAKRPELVVMTEICRLTEIQTNRLFEFMKNLGYDRRCVARRHIEMTGQTDEYSESNNHKMAIIVFNRLTEEELSMERYLLAEWTDSRYGSATAVRLSNVNSTVTVAHLDLAFGSDDAQLPIVFEEWEKVFTADYGIGANSSVAIGDFNLLPHYFGPETLKNNERARQCFRWLCGDNMNIADFRTLPMDRIPINNIPLVEDPKMPQPPVQYIFDMDEERQTSGWIGSLGTHSHGVELVDTWLPVPSLPSVKDLEVSEINEIYMAQKADDGVELMDHFIQHLRIPYTLD